MCAPSRKHQRVCDGTRKSLPAAVKHSGAACNVLRVRRAGNVKYDVRNATYRVQHAKCHNTHACAHTETHTLTHRHTHSHRDTETQKRERHMHTGTQAHTDAHTPRCHVRSYQPTRNMHLAVNMHRSQRGEPDCIIAHTVCLSVLERCAQQVCVPLFESSEDEVRCAGGYNDRKRGGKKRCSARTDDAPPQVAAAVCDHLNGPGQAHRSTRPTSPSW